MAQEAAADPLKFSASKPTVIGWVVRADKTAEFEAVGPASGKRSPSTVTTH
jgi:hypothetical protein